MRGRALLLILLLLPARAAFCRQGETELVLHTACRLGPSDLPPIVLPAGEPGLLVGGIFKKGGEEEGRAWKTLLPRAGWKVLALSRADLLKGGKARAPLAGSRDPAVLGAGLSRGEGSSTEVFRVITVRGVPVAFLGAPGPDVPKEALEKALARARSKARLVVLLAAMPAWEAASLLRGLKGVDLCLAQGGPAADPAPVKIGGARLVQVPMGGEILGRVRLLLGPDGIRGILSEFLPPAGPPDPGLQEAGRKLGLPPFTLGRPGKAWAPPGGEGGLSPLSASNRACRFQVRHVDRRTAYGSLEAPKGREFLVVDLEVENTIPLSDAKKEKLPVAYQVPDLSDHLYLVRDGRVLERILPKCASLAGCLPVRPLLLERLGTRKRGNLLFLLPRGWKGALQLRFYDFVHGNVALDLVPGGKEGPGKPVLPPVRNRFLEMAVFGRTRTKAYKGRKAPEGMAFLVLDLRGRSLFFFKRKASVFDPGAKEGAEVRIGTVADWKDCPRYLQVVADGDRAFPPLDTGELGDAPRFLPDLFTGGKAVFLVPGPVTGHQAINAVGTRFYSLHTNDHLRKMAPADDVNGDGVPDLLIGTMSSDVRGLDAGAVWLFYGWPGL